MEINNPCVRCGKPRILSETWTDSFGNSTIVRSIWICPDSECQMIVAVGIKEKKEKAETLRREIEAKTLARKAAAKK